MIKKAIVVLPPRGKDPAHTEAVNPVAHIAGLTLIQRTLYSLKWAGIDRGLIFSPGAWPEAEQHIRLDPRVKAFSWISSGASGQGASLEEAKAEVLGEDWIVHFPYWIVDRQTLKDLCKTGEPLNELILFEPPFSLPPVGGGVPPLALVPGRATSAVFKAFEEEDSPDRVIRRFREAAPVERRNLPEESLIKVEKTSDLAEAEHQLFQRLIKPTESFLSKAFERKVSLAITRRLLHTRITPNQISIGSILLGIFSALLFLGESRILHVLGGTLLVFSSIVDGCDGEVARLRFQESRWGSWLDFLGDNLVHTSVFLCIGFGLYLRSAGTVYIVLGCLAALGALGAASAVFLRVFLKSDGVITFATPVRVEEMDRAQGWLRRRIEFTDKLSNRDFFYLILITAAVGQLWIFAWVSAFGVLFYLFNLIYLYHRMRTIR